MDDARGFLERLYDAAELRVLIGSRQVAQVNWSRTVRRGTVRGMHFQSPPHAEAKLITCVRGSVFDVAVDVRAASPTLLSWEGVVLNGDDPTSVLIPEGFAHGYQALTAGCELIYVHTAPYVPEAGSGLNPEDPLIAISWPEPITELSATDQAWPMTGMSFRGVAT